MSIFQRCCALMLVFCIGVIGCSPVAEGGLDEQKNPHYQAGKQKLSSMDYKGAVESFERAVEDNPRSALAHYELGVLFDQHENDYAAALYHYQKALKLRPNGYPGDNIRLRIPACKQELVKADSLAVINPTALRETERLREENQALRKQVELLQSHLSSRPPAASATAPTSAGTSSMGALLPGSGTGAPSRSVQNTSSRMTMTPGSDSLRTTSGRVRTHSVRAGDTPSSISRQYHIKLNSLLSANPGLDPKRMRIGQVLNIPAS